MESLDMKVSISIKDKSFEGSLQEIMRINESNLIDEFTKQPSTYAWFATLLEIALADVESKKFDLSILEANLDKEKRVELSEREGKVTESMVKSAVVTDKRFIALTQEVAEVSRQQGILKALVKSLEQRKDMLIQIGSTKRQEMVLSDFGIDLKKIREQNS